MHFLVRGLATIESSWYFAVLLLTVHTTARRLAFAGRWTTTFSDLFAVGAWIVGEGPEDGSIAILLVMGV